MFNFITYTFLVNIGTITRIYINLQKAYISLKTVSQIYCFLIFLSITIQFFHYLDILAPANVVSIPYPLEVYPYDTMGIYSLWSAAGFADSSSPLYVAYNPLHVQALYISGISSYISSFHIPRSSDYSAEISPLSVHNLHR